MMNHQNEQLPDARLRCWEMANTSNGVNGADLVRLQKDPPPRNLGHIPKPVTSSSPEYSEKPSDMPLKRIASQNLALFKGGQNLCIVASTIS
jgi:hypothetical protein